LRRALCGLVLALSFVALHAILRGLGLAAHTSAITGMPIDAWSLPIAALYVVAYLGAIVVAPILALASLVEAAFLRLKPDSRSVN
jgi:hypothetical protein